jgi:large subunit ribosomal protein L18
MKKEKKLQKNKIRTRARIRKKIIGTSERPRLNVYRSNLNIFAQIINDAAGVTLISASSKEIEKKGTKTEISLEVGKLLAKKALEKKITAVVFDKSSYKYHGRVKALADGAREGGLIF